MAIGNRLNRRLGNNDRFDPNAIDGDNDGFVQEGTRFRRPAVIGSISRSSRDAQNLESALSEVSGATQSHKMWARIANENNWIVKRAPNGHIWFISPDKNTPPILTNSTPSDARSIRNAEADLRRAGLPIPRGTQKPKTRTFLLEEPTETLSSDVVSEALAYAARSLNDSERFDLDTLSELLEVPENLKPELKKTIEDKFPEFFTPGRRLSRRTNKLSGSIKKKYDYVPESLYDEAEAAGVDLNPTLDDSDFDNDVEWSSNSWSFAKTKKQQAADAIIVRTNSDGEKEVLLIKRKTAPFTDGYALPGGLLDEGETLEQTADREMEEEVGVSADKATNKKYLGEIEARDWDPRFVEGVRVGGARYDVPEDTNFLAASDATSAEWIPVKDLATGKYRIGFGHAGWLALAFEDEPELARKFDILTRASRYRNQKLIKKVNEKRKAAGEKLFTNLGSANKHYMPEGSGPLGMRRVENLTEDLAKVVTRNPGFFDKETEEIFIYRSGHSASETAEKFGTTADVVNQKLLDGTRKIEQKIRADIAKSIIERGRKNKGITVRGAINNAGKSSPAIGINIIDEAIKNLVLNDAQISSIRTQTNRMHSMFRTGEIFDRPIHASIDNRRREILSSIRIVTASGGLPMIIAEPNPLIRPLIPSERDFSIVELPSTESTDAAMKMLLSKQVENDYFEDLSGISEFYSFLDDLQKTVTSRKGNVEGLRNSEEKEEAGEPYSSGYTSWIEEYYLSLTDPIKATRLLEGFDLGMHDFFGHFGTGRAYDRHGEWANYLAMHDMIENGNHGLDESQKDGLHRFWLREFGTLQLHKREDLAKKYGLENLGRLEIGNYSGQISEVINLLDTDRNGLQSGSLKGSIASNKKNFTKLVDMPLSSLQKIVKDDAQEMLKSRRSRYGTLAGAMGIYESEEELGAYIDELKKLMGKEWDGPQGAKVKKASERLFKIDISEDERNKIIDDLLDIEVEFTDYEPEDNVDDYDYALDNIGDSDENWNEYLAYLERTNPESYDVWKDYNPETGAIDVDDSKTPFEKLWEEAASKGPTKEKPTSRKLFGKNRNVKKSFKFKNKTKYFGKQKVKQDNAAQLEKFREWKTNKNWKALHSAHYDWWAFPIDRGSRAYGDGYSVAGQNYRELKKDREFISNLKEMATIYAEAMGWDLNREEWLENLDWDKGQDPYINAYGARLYKVARSLQVFGLKKEFDSFVLMVESLRQDEKLKSVIGKSEYWENVDVPINKITPGERRRFRRARNISGSMAAPKKTLSRPGPRTLSSASGQSFPRYIRELTVDDWMIFVDDYLEYFKKIKSREINVSRAKYMKLLKVSSLLKSIEPDSSDKNKLILLLKDEEIRELRLAMRDLIDDKNFFNISDIYKALPTKSIPKTIEAMD